MKCKACKDEKNQIKAGKTSARSKKYKCKRCGKYYVLEGKKRVYSEMIKKLAIKLYMEGNSGQTVGRMYSENWEKYVPVLDSKICKGDRVQRDAKHTG